MTGTRTAIRPHQALRTAIHLLVVVIGWVGFVWMWLLVAARPWESQRLVWLILGSLLVLPLITGAWVLHNRSIHRRKGDRRAVPVVEAAYTHDWHGRSVQADWAVLQRCRIVLISPDAAHKRYHGTLAGLGADTVATADSLRQVVVRGAVAQRVANPAAAHDRPRP
jgi:hypothetical protein